MTDYNQTLTLNMIRAHGPCEDGWRKLLSGLGKTAADDEPLTIADVYRINGYDDALWCLRALPDDRLSRHFQAWCAEQVLYLFERKRPGDTRVRDQIVMLRRDDATEEERGDVYDAAYAAAWEVAWGAVYAAASAAASDDVYDAPYAAARAAALDAASDDAYDAARAAQEHQFRLMIGVDQ